MVITNAQQSIFRPAISPRPRMIVRKVLPRFAVRAVVFANRAPCPLGQVGSPTPPVFLSFIRFNQALPFRVHFAILPERGQRSCRLAKMLDCHLQKIYTTEE